MNLARFVTWDTLITTAVGLLFGLTVGNHYSDWTLGCLAFSGAQYLMHNFIYLNRIDRNLQILILRTELKKSMDESMRHLEALRKEVEQDADRRQ